MPGGRVLALMIAEKPKLGVCYYPEHWPRDMWEDDARRMVDVGISLVRIGEFAWSRLEPSRDELRFEWLDEAIETLGRAGLKIIMCTPTATPPKWLVDEMPDMVAVGGDGLPRQFGSRRHYDFCHLPYRNECARIVELLARRYGENPHVTTWQTDNEYGCHDTTLSYSDASQRGFRKWLGEKYPSPAALNEAWGNVFWSMEVSSFDEVVLPNLTVTEPNPAHVLDFRRFASDQVAAFNRMQTDILRKHAPGRDLIHNFMGRYTGFDHFDVATDLDIASWDSYPLGFLERFGKDGAWKNWYLRSGDPDFQAFHHDLYRGCGRGRWWVMEQQPGPVNWAAYNPAPNPGAVRMWSHEAFSHGAEVVSYFRWRQAPFAQEQMHTGLNRPDNSPDRAYREVEQVARELDKLPRADTLQADVALVFDYPSIWAGEIQPQGDSYDGFALIMHFYSCLRKFGQNIDVVAANASFDNYKLVVAPYLLMVDDDLVERVASSGARFLFGPRTGSRTLEHRIPDRLPPGPLAKLIDMKVLGVESLRPGIRKTAGHLGAFERWCEDVETGREADILLTTDQSNPAWVRQGKVSYLAGWPDEDLLTHIVHEELEAARIEFVETGDDLRVRDRGELRTIVNYGPKPRDASHLVKRNDEIVIGDTMLDVAGVLVVRKGAAS